MIIYPIYTHKITTSPFKTLWFSLTQVVLAFAWQALGRRWLCALQIFGHLQKEGFEMDIVSSMASMASMAAENFPRPWSWVWMAGVTTSRIMRIWNMKFDNIIYYIWFILIYGVSRKWMNMMNPVPKVTPPKHEIERAFCSRGLLTTNNRYVYK